MAVKEIEVEVLPPKIETASSNANDPAPVHALSALVLAAVDSLWAVFDWVPPLWIIMIPGCFVCVFVPVFLIQKYLKGNLNGRALTFATLFGVLAAIPTPVMGTPVGLALLAWTGLGKLFGKTAHK